MATNLATPRGAYHRSTVLTASQGQLIVLLYDGAGRYLIQARVAMSERQLEDAHQKLRRAEMIIEHLRASLDFEQGGELSVRLHRIYTFALRHLNHARVHSDPERIEQTRELLASLRGAWAQVAR